MSSPFSSINGTSDGLARSVEQVNQTVHGAIDSATAAVHAPVDRLAGTAHRLAERASAAASQAAESIDGAATRLRNSPTELAESFRSHVQEHPLRSVGIAAAIGLFAGLLIRGR